ENREGGRSEVERMGSADPPLVVHCLYADRHCQLRRPGTGRWGASALGHLLAAAAARLAPVQRSVFVRVAICRQVAPWEESMKQFGANTGTPPSEFTSMA